MISKNLDRIIEERDQAVLLDLSWILHKNYHVFRDMGVYINGYKRPTGHMYGYFSLLETIKKIYPNSVIIVCQDGVPVRRQQISTDGYKDGREELEYNFYNDISLLKLASFLIGGVFWAYNEDQESDDLMYALANQIEYCSGIPVIIYSGDNDLLQAINQQTKVSRKVTLKGFECIDRRMVMTEEVFTKKFHGVDPEHIVFYRTIVGDSSDNIKGIPRFPRKLAVEIAMQSSCLEDFWDYEPLTQTEKKYCDLIRQNWPKMKQNYELMKLNDEIHVKLFRAKPDIDRVVEELSKLQLRKFLRYVGKDVS